MSVSVVIVTHNDERYVAAAISSISRMSGLELIIVDDSSTDNSSSVLHDIRTKHPFTLLKTDKNSGPSVARNLGVSVATGQKLAFLDGDDYWLPQRLEKMLVAAKTDPSVDVLFADALIEQEGTLTETRQSSLMPIPSNTSNMLEHLFKRNCINMCAVLMRTDLAKKVMFDESLRSAEDYDFWLRVAATGAKFKYIDEPLVVYRRYGRSLSSNRLHSIESTLKMLDKNEHLATTKTAKRNLAEQRLALYEEQLLYAADRATIMKSIGGLKRHRALGKKESIIYVTALLLGPVGVLIKKRLVKQGDV